MRKVSSLLKEWLSECMAMRSGIQPVSACRSMFCQAEERKKNSVDQATVWLSWFSWFLSLTELDPGKSYPPITFM